jgi:thiazole synthase ThiGH ThiG subunit
MLVLMVFFKYCSCSINPAQMASAMKLGVQAGAFILLGTNGEKYYQRKFTPRAN